MDRQHDIMNKGRTITGDFLCSQQEPDTTNNNAKENKFSKIPSRCELNCDNGSLSIYGLSPCSMKIPFLILPKIWKVTRSKHDKEFFCLEYGTETERFNIFLTITYKSVADDWEYELCKITGQTPPSRRRVQTGPKRPKRPNAKYTLSSPGAPEGFSLAAEQEDLNDEPTEADANDATNVDTHNDDTLLTFPSGSQEELPSTESSTSCSSEQTVSFEPKATLPRDGQKYPQESHIGEVVGFGNVSPSPGSSPNSRLSYEVPDNNQTEKVLEEASLKSLELEEQQQQQQLQQQQQQQPNRNEERLSEILPLSSRNELLPGELRSTEGTYTCTYVEIECSQEKLSVAVNKEDFLNTYNDITDIFGFHKGFIYLKICPENLQHQLLTGTRIIQVNNQEPVSVRAAIDYITTSAGKTVNLLVQLFPLGVRVRLCVPSLQALGIRLHGNEIKSMRRDGVLSKIADGLKCVCPALSTSDTPIVEQRSITAIGDHHVPYDATTEEVEVMLDTAINRGNGHLVLQLHPSEFCHAMALDALQRRLLEDDGAVLNPTPARKLSLARSLKSNPPS